MDAVRADLLADAIWQELQDTETGHCARVDFLERDEAVEVCRVLAMRCGEGSLTVRILASDANAGELFITTDEAIELRNRKETRLCLFVPTDLVDAAFSSLANSFAPLDGRDLHARALDRLQAQLADEARRLVRAVFNPRRLPLRESDD